MLKMIPANPKFVFGFAGMGSGRVWLKIIPCAMDLRCWGMGGWDGCLGSERIVSLLLPDHFPLFIDPELHSKL